jgi:uncharacterized membrane protein YoaK (UPF0700 family)
MNIVKSIRWIFMTVTFHHEFVETKTSSPISPAFAGTTDKAVAGTTAADTVVAGTRKPGDLRRSVTAVLLLNAATGVVEAVSYAHLGGLFAAYVTGTVVLAGLKLGVGGISVLLPYAVAFGGFLLGSVLGGTLIRSAHGRVVRAFITALIGELVAVILAVVAFSVIPQIGALFTLGLLAAAMAMQFSATKNLAVPDLGFAAATGLIHSLVHDINAARHAPSRLPRKLLAIATLLGGALVGGLISQYAVVPALLVALALIVAAGLFAAAPLRRR